MHTPTGYFDLQVNGYGGVDYNKEGLTADELHRSCERLAQDGVTGFLATVITEKIDLMAGRLAKLVELRAKDELAKKMIAGFHIEGPFINEENGYKGAHPVDAIHPANEDETKRLLEATAGLTKLVTLAPERDEGFKVTKLLVKNGVAVSAGHCNPSLDLLKASCDAGVSLFTHLGNGCPMQQHRHENIVQRALSLYKHLRLCFIADGAHIAFYALGNYLRAAGIDRCAVVTDAVAPAGLGPGTYTVGRWTLKIGEDMVARAPDGSHLVGAAISMPQTVTNLVEKVGLSKEDALRLTVENPRKAIGLA
ncbi:MAG: N-acetylglucosamine-6-phosphate deacetylase [Planctomycetota bacterium]|nr:N-acetylglucosamine-6-phosphate deacetylase [Planctomycetota bacterium]